MPKEKNEEMRLPSLDELFSSQEERDDAKLKRIYEIPISEIDPFPDHPFHVRDDEDMMNLVESVKANGVITPATVRKKEDGRYELLSGHRRMRACEIAGMDTLRCEVVDMDRDEATVFMVESNFQRTTILPSEKAFAYKMRLEAMNRQGKRTDLTCGPAVHKSRDEVGDVVGESGRTVSRYIRLTELIPELLEMVDEGKIALRPAVEISYLLKIIQGDLWEHGYGTVHTVTRSVHPHEKNAGGRKAHTRGYRSDHAGGKAEPERTHRAAGSALQRAVSTGSPRLQKRRLRGCCHGVLRQTPGKTEEQG